MNRYHHFTLLSLFHLFLLQLVSFSLLPFLTLSSLCLYCVFWNRIRWANPQQPVTDKESCSTKSPSSQGSTQANQVFCLKAYDLPIEAKETELSDLFGAFPSLISVKVKYPHLSQSFHNPSYNYHEKKKSSNDTSDSLLAIILPYALIEYGEVTSAIAAMKELDGRMYAGKPLQ